MDMAEGSSCVFGNILDRLPGDARAWLQSAWPPPDLMPEGRRKCFESIAQWLMDNRQRCFADKATCHCLVHHGMCDVSPANRFTEDFSNIQRVRGRARANEGEAFCTIDMSTSIRTSSSIFIHLITTHAGGLGGLACRAAAHDQHSRCGVLGVDAEGIAGEVVP